MNLRDQWITASWRLARQPASFYSGSRKIIRSVRLSFTLDDSLTLADAGFTKSKLTMLTKNYLHQESRDVAIQLWRRRCDQAKYGSVSFTTFAHFVKGGSIDARRSKRASVFGPCIQSITLTWIDRRNVGVDVFYRTTEFFKKFAPDLVFIRDVLLPPFKLNQPVHLTCHFANVTIHPMYAVTIMPHLDDPIRRLEELRRADDPHFFRWIVKWTARYICPEYAHGIAKFAQSVRVQKDVLRRLDPKQLRELRAYVRKHHPGFRGDNRGEEDEAET